MPTVERTFPVAPPPAEVIAYLKDFSNAEEWDPGTKSCTQTTPGPVAVGTTWRNVSKIAGVKAELDYELRELTDDRLSSSGPTRARRPPTPSRCSPAAPAARSPTVPSSR